jgi:streptogramin lyase
MACLDGSCRRLAGFSGATGTAWELAPTNSTLHGLQSFVPSGSRYLYAAAQSSLGALDLVAGTWRTLASPPRSLPYWGSVALSQGALWEILSGAVVRYDPASNTWTVPNTTVMTGDDAAMTVADRDGILWGFIMTGRQLVRYDPVANTLRYFPSGVTTSTYETRLGYDTPTHSIYFGGFGASALYRFDIATSRVTTLMPHPEGQLNDIFCADHSGHLYAAGGSTGTTLWQYDIAGNSWRRIPDFPVDHGNNGTCAVLEDGYLHVEPGNLSIHRRLRLL